MLNLGVIKGLGAGKIKCICVCVFICVWALMHVSTLIHVHFPMEAEVEVSVLLDHFLSFTEIRSLLTVSVSLASQLAWGIPCLCLQGTRVPGGPPYLPGCRYGIHTPILMLGEQVFIH